MQFFFYLVERGFFAKKALLQVGWYRIGRGWGLVSLPLLHTRAFQAFLEGKNQRDFEELARNFADREFSRLFCPKMLLELENAKRRGEETLLLSTSPHFLVSLFAEKFGIARARGSTYHLNSAGHFSAIAKTMYGEQKRQFVESLCRELAISKNHTLGFSDSIEDLPLLNQLGEVRLIRPDRRLRALSRKRGWQVL